MHFVRLFLRVNKNDQYYGLDIPNIEWADLPTAFCDARKKVINSYCSSYIKCLDVSATLLDVIQDDNR